MSSEQSQPGSDPKQKLGPLPPEEWPDVEHLVTEDDTPVDIFSGKQQRLLVEPLYTSWDGPGNGRPFLAMSNIGLFYGVNQSPLVPDMMLSLDVRTPSDPWPKINRAYFLWMYAKPPDAVVEIVAEQADGEDSWKLATYAQIGVPYYVIFDPEKLLSDQVLRVYGLHLGEYLPEPAHWLPRVQLGLTLWSGKYEQIQFSWLRWCHQDGTVVSTGAELVEQVRRRREQAELDYEQTRQRTARAQAEQQAADERRERLAARLRELGVDPEDC